MPTDEMLVLACSKKWGGRCVAGISKRTGEWLRPVSDRFHGELGARHYRIGGRDIAPLDIVRLEYGDGMDDPAQPENVAVTASRWQLIDAVDPERAAGVLAPYLAEGPVLLGNRGAAVPADEAALGVEASLALVRPEQPEFHLEPPWAGKDRPRPRVGFSLDGQHYDLALTDYLVSPRLVAAGLGGHSLAGLGFEDDADLLLTISLAEPQDEWCTKLVAAALLLPEGGVTVAVPGNSIRAVLFDIDGTILVTGGAGGVAWQRAFEELHGVEADVAEHTDAGMTDPEIAAIVFREVIGREGSAEERAKAIGCYLKHLPAAVAESAGYRVMPGIEELLERLIEAGTLLGLVTGNIEAAAHIKLARAGLNRFFSFGGYGSDSADRTEVTKAALSRGSLVSGGTLADGACIAVGDTPRDVEAGHGAGLAVAGVATGSYGVEQLREAGADFALETVQRGFPL